jgi:hypothetical protein
MIPLRVHNILDYVIGVALLAAPGIFGFSDIDAARNVFTFLGAALIGYSLFTRYRYSIAKVIPVGVHMTMDVISGLIVMIAPWLFGYSDLLTGGQTAVHFIFGLGAIALVTFTRTKTDTARIVGVDDRTDDRDLRRVA